MKSGKKELVLKNDNKKPGKKLPGFKIEKIFFFWIKGLFQEKLQTHHLQKLLPIYVRFRQAQ